MIILDFPRPVPINQLWRARRAPGKVRFYRTPRYMAWLQQFGLEWMRQAPRGFKTITGEFITTLIVIRGRADNDSYAKAALDAAQKMGIIADDKHNLQTLIKYGTKEDAPLGCRMIIEPC